MNCWTRAFPIRRPSTIPRFASLCLVLLAGMSWSTAAFGAIWPEDETPEQRYWKKVREERTQKKIAEERRVQRQREAARADIPRKLRISAAVQPGLITAQDGP